MINSHKAPIRDLNDIVIEDGLLGEWKIQLTMQVNFISSLDPEKIRKMHSKSDNVEITMDSETDDIIKKLFESFLKKYKDNLDKIKESKYLYGSVDLLYYSLHKISLKRVRSYQKSPKWIRDKGATINPKSKIINVFEIL